MLFKKLLNFLTEAGAIDPSQARPRFTPAGGAGDGVRRRP
jgi:hypothetical protein